METDHSLPAVKANIAAVLALGNILSVLMVEGLCRTSFIFPLHFRPSMLHKAAPFGRSEIVFPYSYDAAPLLTQPAFPPIYLGGCCCFCCCWGCCSLAACASPRLG